MARSDDILKKYGVTQVTVGSGKPVSSSGNNSPGSSNSILDKYGVSQVRGGKAYDAEKIRDWFNGTYSALQSGSKYLSQDGYRKPNTSFSSVYEKYMDDADDVARFIEENRSSIENYGDVLDMYNKSVSYLRKMNSNIQKSNEFFSQFSNEDDYNTAVRYGGYYQKYNGQTYGQLQDTLSKMEDGEEKDWLTKFAPQTMTERDFGIQAAQYNTDIYYAQKYLDEIKKAGATYGDGDPQNDLILRNKIKELNEEYGFHSRQEAEDKIEELKAKNWEYQKTREYGFLDQNADYGELSSVVSEDKTAGVGIGVGTRWFGKGDPVYDYINNIDGAREVHPAQKGKTPYSIYDYMDEKEIADYNYLYNTKGKEAAQEYLDYLKYALDQRRMEKLQENTAAYATEHPVISSALSVPMNLLSGAGVLDVAGQYAARKISGEYKPINYNRSGMVPTTVTMATRGTVAKNIADATGTISLDAEKHPILSRILNGKSLGDVYQLGMSMADSAAIAGLAAVGIPGGTALLGGSAASQGVLDALEAGADDTQALTMGILNGVFEMLFEEVSLEKLLKGNTKGIVRSILEQGAVEGSEEFFTTLANTVADIAVMAEKSDYRSKIAEYMSQGLNEKQATLRAIEDIAIGMGWDFVGGMMTGGIMGGVSKPIQNYTYASETGKLLYGSDPGALVSEALETDPENKLAEKMKGKLGSGESVSGYQLYKLAQQNETALRGQDTDAIQKAASVRLKELGETGDVEAISAALAKQASGESLSKGESQLIQESKYGNRVSQELNQENIRSGDYASDWAKNIGTKRIGLDVYNQSLEQASIGKSEPIDGTKNDSIVINTLNTESKTAKNDSIRQAAVEDKPFELSDETGKTLLNLADGSTVETEIISIASTEKGKLMLNVAGQSEPVKASSISYASTADAILYNAINSMEISPEDAKRFVNLARSSGDTTGDFAVGIQEMYILGKSGVPISKAMNSSYGAKLSDTNKRFGYGLGRALYNAQVQKAEAEKKNVSASQRARASTGGTKVNGVQYDGLTVSKGKDGSVAIDGVKLNDQQKAGIQAAEMLASMGVNIHVFHSQTDANGKPIGENGSYSLRDGSIHIDLNAGNLGQGVMAYTIAHEFTHFMEQQSPAKFQAFTDALFAELDVDVEAEIERKAEELKQQQPEQYKNASRETLLQDARSEVVAEACETMLTDTDAAQRIGQSLKSKDATLFEKVKQWFRDLAAKLREAYKDLQPDSEIAQAAKKTIQQVDGLVQMWADMAVDAAENYSTTDGEKNTTMDSGVKLQARSAQYDYSKSFSDQVDDYKNNLIPNGDSLVVGPTPEVFQKIGFNSLPVTINTTHVDYALYGTKDLDHFLGETALKSLPQSLKDPVAVFVSQTQKNTSVVALLKFTTNGKQTVVPVLIDGYSRQNGIRIDSNAITSVFGKTNAVSKLLYDAVNDESNGKYSLLYWNKKEAISLLQRARLQLPGGLMPRDGFIHSIRESSSPVKAKFQNVTETQQFKRWFGDWQKHPDRASKIVNADGTPKIVYHQTSSDFTIFDTRHEGAGTRDSDTPFGIFLKSSDKDIGLKGGKQMALYARIANPLVVQNREELISRLRNISNDYSQAADELRDLNADYSKKIEDAKEAWNNYMAEWRKEHPGASRKALYDDERFNQLFDAEDELIDEWESEARKIETRCKEAITRDLEAKGYDGVIIKQDKGSFGRTTDAYIALHPEQVKSATDNIGTFDKNNPDIRYSQRQQDQHAALEKQNGKLLEDVKFSNSDSDYMDAIKRGDMKTAKKMVEQAAKDSGYTRLFYHGSKKGGGFKIFRDWQYFTENKEYAKRYTDRGNAESLYTTYVKMDNPFDTRITEVRKLFRDARMEYGMGELQENGLPDWTDGYDIADFIDENDLPYDSIVLDEGGDMVNGKPVSRGLSYVIRKSNQIKSADIITYDDSGNVIPLSQRFNTQNNDIRYSQRQQDQQAALEKQNEKLREDVERLRELLKLQGKTTGGKLFKPESIKTAANFIMRETGRSLDADGKAEFSGILTKAYTALSDENVTYDDIIRECTNVAQWLDENGETQDALDEYAGGILSQMKGIPIRLDETQKAEARHLFGSLREFRSRIAGTYKLSPNGVPLDDVWNGLSMEHPMFFDGDASSAGLPGLLVEAIDRLRGCVNTDPYQHMSVDMMMRKVYDGFWKAKKLTTVADRYQSKIDAINAKHDAAMQEMQEAHKAEIADLNRQWDEEAAAMEKSHKYDLEEQERLHKEHLRQVREEMNHDAKAELEKVIGKYTDQRKASVENRHRTQYREQIYKMADKFHKIATAPAKANTAHAPIQLVNAVSKFCEIFADSEERALEYAANRLDSRETELRLMNDLRGETKTRLKEADAINRQRERLYKKHQAVSAMKEQYSKIQDDPAFGMFYDEHVNGLLESLSKQLDGTDIYDMDTEQLKQVYSTMQAMMYTITNANRVFSMEKDKTLIGVTRKLAGEIDANKISHGAFVSGLRDYGMWQMSPDTFFNFVCGFKKGNEGKAIQRMFVDGSDRMLTVQRDFYQMFRHLTEAEDKNVRKHIARMMKNPMKEMIDWGLKDAAGNTVKTTRDMMLQAYMLLNQKDSFDSLIYGGFKLPNAKDYYNGKIDRAYGNAEESSLLSASIENEYGDFVRQIKQRQDAIDGGGLDVATVNQLQEEINGLRDQAIELVKGSEARLIELRNAIEAKLTEADLDAIETARRWYKYTGQLMTDVYLQMYGYRPNLVDGYVPIHRDLSTVKTDIREGEEDKAFNLENSGFTKDRVKSRAPILLTGFFQELQSQQNKISRYYGFAQVQKDFNRIWNMRVPGYGMTINGKVAAKFGTGKRWLGVSGEQYVLNYIQSVAGVKGNEDILSSFYGNAASATLSANPRVAVSQLASIPTAAAVVGWKSMAKGFAKGVSTSISTEKKNLLVNDSVWFFQRYRGAGGITEISDLKAKGGIWGKIANSPVGKALFNWCQSMDVFATASMWAMAEDYVQKGGMKSTDDGYKLAVEQCYADIIRRSQPNYTVTERSDLLRDKRGGMKLLTMYKTQSNQNLNILINSIGEYRAAVTAMRSVKNETTISDFRSAQKNLVNGITSVTIGGTLAFVLLRTLVNFIMAKVDPYRDDETDELTMESMMGAVTKEVFSSISGMFALGGQLYDIVNSVVSGDNYYGISDSAISSLAAVPENMVALIQRWKDPDKDVEWKHVEKVLSSSLALCGIPYKNLKSFYDAAGQWYRDLKGGTLGQYIVDATDEQYSARILKAWQSDDMEKINDTLAILAAKSEKDTDEDILKDVTHGFANDYLKKIVMDDEMSPDDAADLLKYIGHDDPDGVVQKWVFQVRHPDIDSNKISDKLVSSCNQRGDISEKVFMDAYWFASSAQADKDKDGKSINGSKKAKIVKYIQRIPGLSFEQQKRLYILLDVGSLKDTPWE